MLWRGYAVLSNIRLHYELDLWIEQWRRRQAHGDVILVRYADDCVMGFQPKAEAEQLPTEQRERFTQFNLSLHPEKARLIEFGRQAAADGKRRGEGKPETFGFLGLTHNCDVTRARGKFIVLWQTNRKRIGAKLKEIKERLRDRMPEPIAQTGRWLRAVVSGCSMRCRATCPR